jgi:hypothetical protein
MDASLEEARAAKRKAVKLLKRHPSVNGVGITRAGKGYAIKVNLVESGAVATKIPVEIDGVPVRSQVVGRITKPTAAAS